MMKKVFLAFLFTIALGAPAFATTCTATSPQIKDNAGTTSNVTYVDDGTGSGNCLPEVLAKQLGTWGVTVASGGIASGAIASGAVASGAYASGAFAVGAGTDGWDVTLGTKADTAWSSGSGTLIAIAKAIAGNTGAAIPAQSNTATNIGQIGGQVNITPTDCSSTITTGGAAQNAFAASATIHGFTIANLDTTEALWISLTGTATASAAGSYPLAAATATTFQGGGSFTTPIGFGINHAVSVIAATTGHKFSCTTW